ncbi:MotB family protein [Rhizobium sp. YIM 134829]|uniref:MotB family protein n=1 Tax=Rhizobium sp. YIM 134829 TaxID=3390453 RepID=UPI00397E3C07
MSENEGHHGKNEIIIIKRHHGGHDGHHGGAWKIAYADFMTAMMAFFLVMWLINASNAETKAAIASYFNPVQLTDEKPSEKGVKKPAKDAKGEETQEKSEVDGEQSKTGGSAKTGDDMTATSGEETKYSDADFFENPYSVLSEIMNQTGQQANISRKGDGGAGDSGPATGAEGGEAFRDPFDPDFWAKQVELQAIAKNGGPSATETAFATPATDTETAAPAAAAPEGMTAQDPASEAAIDSQSKDNQIKDVEAKDIQAKEPGAAKDVAQTKGGGKAEGKAAPDPMQMAALQAVKDGTDEAAKPVPKPSTEQVKAAIALKSDIDKAIGGAAGKLAEGLIVTPTEGGLLVTISEQVDTPMFTIGSSVPEKSLVVAMEKLGKVLADRPGAIAIRGHTDGRPFKNGVYDNWRLSADRAQSAYYMLVHGGLAESRVSQITGFADKRLQVPEDPLAPANRRIEILLQTSGS